MGLWQLYPAVSAIDGATSLWLLRQCSKALMANIELGTKGMGSTVETSLRSSAEVRDMVRLLVSGWSAGNQHDLELKHFSLCQKSLLRARQEGKFCFKICCNKK